MAVDNPNIIDVISTKNGKTVLIIADHLNWDDTNGHLVVLQEKINAYLDVIQDGQIYELYSDARDRPLSILLFLKYLPNENGLEFLQQTKDFLNKNGFEFEYRHKA